MKISNSKNYISLNLLSFSGYLYLLVWLYVYFIVRPDIMAWRGDIGSDPETVGMAHSSIFVDIIFSLFILCFIISIILLGLFIIEHLLRKKKIIPEYKQTNNSVYLFIFWAGIILQTSPFFMLLICFFIH